VSFQANYFDGIKASHKPVLVRVAEHAKQIIFDVDGETLTFNLADLEVQAKLGSAKRLIDLPNGGMLEAADIGELEAAMPSKISTFWRGLHYLENHLGWVFVAMLLTVFAGWMFLQFGVPKMAEYVADITPPSMETKIGEQVLAGLDSQVGYFSPSKAEPKRRASVIAELNQLCTTLKTCPQYRLEFRDGGEGDIGANAFALPGGIVVMTDQLITLSKNDTEVVAVLAHELGHVNQRHAFRQSLQGVLAGLILAAITGDVSSVASGLPAALMQMKYSRAHETEADMFALNAMQTACLPPKAFADILQRLQNQALSDEGDDKTTKPQAENNTKSNKPKSTKPDPVLEMLASHPDTQVRIQPFLAAKQDCNQASKI
jgi:Zn-dependent protease with chaperone function